MCMRASKEIMERDMKLLRRCWATMKSNNHYIAMILIQFAYAGMSLLSKAAITQGMNPYVFVVYRQALATAALAPFAFFIERVESSATLSSSLLCKTFLASLCGITMSLNLYYIALHYVSATFATAFTNIGPAITFLLAVCLRIEKISLRDKHGLVKLLGSTIGISGALIFTFVKGPPMHPTIQQDIVHQSTRVYSKADWIKGSLVLLLCNLSWSVWLIMQGPIIKQYPAKLRLTTLQCFFSSVQSAIWAIAHDKSMASWKLGWNVNLISVVYCGVVVTGITYCLLVWVVAKKGPVFPSLFNPLALIITAAFSAIFFEEILHWGSFCGAILLLVGLYGILWGKNVEEKNKTSGQIPGRIIMHGKITASEHKPETKEAAEATLESIT